MTLGANFNGQGQFGDGDGAIKYGEWGRKVLGGARNVVAGGHDVLDVDGDGQISAQEFAALTGGDVDVDEYVVVDIAWPHFKD